MRRCKVQVSKMELKINGTYKLPFQCGNLYLRRYNINTIKNTEIIIRASVDIRLGGNKEKT